MELDQWRGSWVCFLISPFLFYQLRKNKSNGWEHSNVREVFLGRIQTMQGTTQGAPKQDDGADLQASWEILSWSYVSEEKNGTCRKVDALLQESVRTRGDKKRQVERHSSLGPSFKSIILRSVVGTWQGVLCFSETMPDCTPASMLEITVSIQLCSTDLGIGGDNKVKFCQEREQWAV